MPENPISPVPASALALLVIGIGLTTTGMSFNGFVRGLCQGAGVALILGGVVVLSAHLRRPREDRGDDGLWLPSRDEDR